MCKSLREDRAEGLASFKAKGRGGRKVFDQELCDQGDWYARVPGLAAEVQLLAWERRSESPIVVITTPSLTDIEGLSIQITGMPRSFWNYDPRFLRSFSEGIRERFSSELDAANFSADESYFTLIRDDSRGDDYALGLFFTKQSLGVLRPIEIVESLTSATPEDLAAVIAWMKERLSTLSSHDARYQSTCQPLVEYYERQAAAHGPSRSLCNILTYTILEIYKLEFRVKLVTGLCKLNAFHPWLESVWSQPLKMQ